MSGKKHTAPVRTDRISPYFRAEWLPLAVVTVTGIACNIGMTAGPYFEGRLAQTLADIGVGSKSARDMLLLACLYLGVVLAVQGMRVAKRFYVRRFANNVSRRMKRVLYRNLVHQSEAQLACEGVGSLMAKAVGDVDACVEGMRKFTTEVFDTGVLLLSYTVMLFFYDARLALLASLFPPLAYLAAELLKKAVTRAAVAMRESAGALHAATLDRVSGAVSYRTLGAEEARDAALDRNLADYRTRAVRAGILESAMPPLYQVLSLLAIVPIVYFGIRNVRGTGFTVFDIAAFTTFLSCYLKLALKSSKAAKLFTSVQKARVSWQRIKPLMQQTATLPDPCPMAPGPLAVRHLTLSYGDKPVLEDISFDACPGEIIGVTGAVACGKTTLGRVFLPDAHYEGSICFGGREWRDLSGEEHCGAVAYLGHEAELLNDTVEANVLLGDDGDAWSFLRAVEMDVEVEKMENGLLTEVGSGGVRLSGGQQARLALARTLSHARPLLILDDPFSALDRKTEEHLMQNLRRAAQNAVVLLLSHRMDVFRQADRVLFLQNGGAVCGTHASLLAKNEQYRALYLAQTGGDSHEA